MQRKLAITPFRREVFSLDTSVGPYLQTVIGLAVSPANNAVRIAKYPIGSSIDKMRLPTPVLIEPDTLEAGESDAASSIAFARHLTGAARSYSHRPGALLIGSELRKLATLKNECELPSFSLTTEKMMPVMICYRVYSATFLLAALASSAGRLTAVLQAICKCTSGHCRSGQPEGGCARNSRRCRVYETDPTGKRDRHTSTGYCGSTAPSSDKVAQAGNCGLDPNTCQQYRFDPITGRPCDGRPAPVEQVAIRRAPPAQPNCVPTSAQAPREPTPEERRLQELSRREQEALVAPTGIRSTGTPTDLLSLSPGHRCRVDKMTSHRSPL